MPRKKADPEPEDRDSNEPPGETLPPIEDFVRKMSTKFNPDTFGDDNEAAQPDDQEDSDQVSEEEE